MWWAFWDDKWRRIICCNYAAFCSSSWSSILLQSFDRENKSESASVQQRAICLGQLLNWDNKPPPFELTLRWGKKQKQTRNLLDCIFPSNRKRFLWCHAHFSKCFTDIFSCLASVGFSALQYVFVLLWTALVHAEGTTKPHLLQKPSTPWMHLTILSMNPWIELKTLASPDGAYIATGLSWCQECICNEACFLQMTEHPNIVSSSFICSPKRQ